MKKSTSEMKKVGVTLIVLGLMIILFAISGKFNNRLKHTVLIQRDIVNLKEHSVLDGSLAYKLPNNWEFSEQIENNNIEYSCYFKEENLKINGFVQVWDTDKSFGPFTNDFKQSLVDDKEIMNVSDNNTIIKGKSVYKLYYEKKINGINIHCYEYLFPMTKNKVIKYSFYVNEEMDKENSKAIFDEITSYWNYNNSK